MENLEIRPEDNFASKEEMEMLLIKKDLNRFVWLMRYVSTNRVDIDKRMNHPEIYG